MNCNVIGSKDFVKNAGESHVVKRGYTSLPNVSLETDLFIHSTVDPFRRTITPEPIITRCFHSVDRLHITTNVELLQIVEKK